MKSLRWSLAPSRQDVYAEVALPDDVANDVTGFGIHPALLDAALHAMGVTADTTQTTVLLSFCWRGVTLQATAATQIRVHITAATGDDAVSIQLADTTGLPVLADRIQSVDATP
jgi:acyl transferase domain-containing protein